MPRIATEPRESSAAKRAWFDYYTMGLARSLEKLAALYRADPEPTPTRNAATLKLWSRRYGWQIRVEQEDAKRLADEEVAQRKVWAARKTRDREDFHDLSEYLRRKSREMLAWPIARQTVTSADGKTTTIIEPGRWDFTSIVRMLQLAATLAEQSGGDTAMLNRLVGKITIREIIAEVPAEVAAEFEEEEQRLLGDSDNTKDEPIT